MRSYTSKTRIFQLCVFLFILTTSLTAQSGKIKGTVLNPQNEPLEFVSVALLHPKDSTMINFTTTDINGFFEITENSKDTLLVQLFSTGYKAHFQQVVKSKETFDFKTLILEENIDLLDEVTITAVIPIQIKKDTIAYNANSFKVNYDENIEGLLKKLPGVELDSDGKISANGNEVTKIFVDGKEFFGGDPSMVLKNLPADAIAKIQIIDKKSDESELTGVEDGNKEVVINFTLKKTKKKRGFGKLSAGMGLDNRYFTNLNYNKFDSKSQFSAIGKFNNINVTGSSIQSFLNNSDGLADESDDDGSNAKVRSLSGYLQTSLAGVHYGREFQKKESFNTDYSYSSSENHGISNTKRTTFNPNSSFDSANERQYHNTSTNHRLNFNYKNQSKRTSSLYIKGGFKNTNSNYLLKRNDSIFNSDNEVKTYTFSDSELEKIQNSANIQANYYKKLDSIGTSFNIGVKDVLNKQNINNTQDTERLSKYDTDSPISKLTEIERDDTVLNNNFIFSFKFTQPLGNDHYFKIESVTDIKTSRENINQNKTETENDTENKFPLIFDQDFDEYRYITNVQHTYNTEKVNYLAGAELLQLDRTFGLVGEDKFNKSQFYVNPTARLQLTPKKGRKYNLTYKKSINSPRNSQITAVINDVNPNYIRKGNPNLKTEKLNTISFRSIINDYKSSLIFVSKVAYTHTDDAIIQTIETDEEFEYIRTRDYANKGTKENANAYISISKKINKIGLRTNLKLKGNLSSYNALVNRKNNDVFSHNYNVNLSFENFNKNIFDVKVGASYTVDETKFSLDEEEVVDMTTTTLDLNRKFIKQHYFAMVDYRISKRLNINSQFDYNLLTDNQFVSNQKIPLWNAAISYALTDNKKSIVKLVLIDLLNKNVDISRRSNLNYFEETTNQSLGRYIVLSYTYRLNGGNKKTKKHKKKNA